MTPRPKPVETLDNVARQRIRYWLDVSGMTQTELATHIGRNQVWLSRYLKGAFDADLTTLQQIAHVFEHELPALVARPVAGPEGEVLTMFNALSRATRRNLMVLLRELRRAASRRRR